MNFWGAKKNGLMMHILVIELRMSNNFNGRVPYLNLAYHQLTNDKNIKVVGGTLKQMNMELIHGHVEIEAKENEKMIKHRGGCTRNKIFNSL